MNILKYPVFYLIAGIPREALYLYTELALVLSPSENFPFCRDGRVIASGGDVNDSLSFERFDLRKSRAPSSD